MSAWQLEFAQLTALEFSEIADVPVENIRLWRSRGHIEVSGGRGSSYAADVVAQTMVRYDLSRFGGMPPSQSAELGRDCATEILRSVLLNYAGACEVRGPEAAVREFHAHYSDGSRLADMIFGSAHRGSFLISVDGAEPQFAAGDLAELIDSEDFRSARIFNLAAYAKRLSSLKAKSVIVFRFPVLKGERETRLTMEVTSNTIPSR
jgi:hypothetical protein